MSETLRFYEAWAVAPDGEVKDECGHVHNTLTETREWHRLHGCYNRIVAIDYEPDGGMTVAKEYRHAPRRPSGFFGALIFDGVNA